MTKNALTAEQFQKLLIVCAKQRAERLYLAAGVGPKAVTALRQSGADDDAESFLIWHRPPRHDHGGASAIFVECRVGT